MTASRTTSGILALAGAVAIAGLFLTRTSEPETRFCQLHSQPTGTLSLAARHQSSHVLRGTTETHIAVTVTAPPDETSERPNLNLSIVLDHSGSMAGNKLEQAKAAAIQLVSSLRKSDQFSIVGYGSEVRVVFPSAPATPSAREEAIRLINHIYDDGGTNLSGGLIEGRTQILLADSDKEALRRIVLISDGRANEGIVNHDDLAALAATTADQNVSITTVGVGLDFDGPLMTKLAVRGRGNYYFAESAESLSSIFQQEFERLGHTLATNASMLIRPAAGVTVLEVYGHRFHHNAEALVLPIADVHAGETRKVVLRVRVNAANAGSMTLATAELSYRDLKLSENKTLSSTARASVTEEIAEVSRGLDKDAVGHVERARTGAAVEEATRMWEHGDAEGAQRVLSQRQAEAFAAADAVSDDSLRREISEIRARAGGNLKGAPGKSPKAKRSRKANGNEAYQLLY